MVLEKVTGFKLDIIYPFFEYILLLSKVLKPRGQILRKIFGKVKLHVSIYLSTLVAH